MTQIMKWLLWVLIPVAAYAQNFEQRGYFETKLSGFPETAPGDASHAIGEGTFFWDASYKARPWLTFSGSVMAQTDTHHETERTFHIDLSDRGLQRPAFGIQTARLTFHRSHFTLDLGKQLIRWGKADILNPTDRFAPRDYLSVVDNDFLGVLAARATVEAAGNSVDLVWTPRFTPSRIPLLNQRWAGLPPNLPGAVENGPPHFPGGGQFGARVNHIGNRYEVSGSYFEGFNHLPLIGAGFDLSTSILQVDRFYPKIRMYGTDSAISFPWVTLKTELGWFQSAAPSTGPQSDDYVLYVAQLERQVGEWIFVGGYAGQTILTSHNPFNFDPERGLSRAFLWRVAYTIDARQNVELEEAVRQNGQGTWTRVEYSRLLGSHWRATADVVVIGGSSMDFLGQYHRNSHGILKIRYSF